MWEDPLLVLYKLVEVLSLNSTGTELSCDIPSLQEIGDLIDVTNFCTQMEMFHLCIPLNIRKMGAALINSRYI